MGLNLCIICQSKKTRRSRIGGDHRVGNLRKWAQQRLQKMIIQIQTVLTELPRLTIISCADIVEDTPSHSNKPDWRKCMFCQRQTDAMSIRSTPVGGLLKHKEVWLCTESWFGRGKLYTWCQRWVTTYVLFKDYVGYIGYKDFAAQHTLAINCLCVELKSASGHILELDEMLNYYTNLCEQPNETDSFTSRKISLEDNDSILPKMYVGSM